jgi:soluble lytic murein transglycosylase-like protein
MHPFVILLGLVGVYILANQKTTAANAPAAGGSPSPQPQGNPAPAQTGFPTTEAQAQAAIATASASSAFATAYAATPYASAIAQAEQANGLPAQTLAALLYQESRFNPNAVGTTPAARGGPEQGIAQFLPATAAQLGVDPTDPLQSIDGAARYLSMLNAQAGGWAEALTAYNWGIGNVLQQGIDAAPDSTQTYVSNIVSNAPDLSDAITADAENAG